MSAPRTYLFVPAGGAGEGLGHLTRCRRLAEQLASDGPRRGPRPRITFLASHIDRAARSLLQSTPGNRRAKAKPDVLLRLNPGRQWDLIVLDNRATSAEELRALLACGPVVCLDEGGEARGSASFLIDAIPRLPGGEAPNLSSLSFLELPARSRRKVQWPPRKALMSFGGEDRENLSGRLLDALLAHGLFSPSQITLVEGPLFVRHEWPRGITVVRNAAGLSRILSSHDVVFTHFGMTAIEAVACGVPSILFNPRQYHARLSRANGFPEIGIRVPDVYALKALLADKPSLQARVESLNTRMSRKRTWLLPTVLGSMRPQGKPQCTVCGRDGNRIVARFPDRTYRACGGCGVMYLESFATGSMKYGARYFGREYKAQYGRTYLQDFEAIKSTSRERLRIIQAVADGRLHGAIVDVGCAFGPFLSAVRDEGLPCLGIDVSEEAVQYVRKRLGVPAIRSSFEELQKRHLPRSISAITLWYVIEHFLDVGLVLRRASQMLPMGGVLAFSTPNGRGISARKNLRQFLENSPPDHFTVFRPSGLDTILASHGFQLRHIRITGHHPERFPGCLGDAALGRRGGSRTLGLASRILKLGDTFEAYAVKVDQA